VTVVFKSVALGAAWGKGQHRVQAPDFLHTLGFANLEVLCHDIRNEGLPEHQFDLAHARLVLMHLPGREVALHRILRSLKPGGLARPRGNG
jgi:SAM-dependent methyltransferase